MAVAAPSDRRRYQAPREEQVARVPIGSLLAGPRTIPDAQLRRLPGHDGGVYCVGDRELVKRRSVALVGSRKVSPEGAARARRLAKELAGELAGQGVVVVSGLAEGVDRNAHQAAIDAGGATIAVIGTPVDRAYPAQNAELQERIYREHLLISPFPAGHPVSRSSFPERNRLMAAISDGTCLVEATDVSGSLHQATECIALGRWLFILRSAVENPALTWPRRFVGRERVVVVERVEEIVGAIHGARAATQIYDP